MQGSRRCEINFEFKPPFKGWIKVTNNNYIQNQLGLLNCNSTMPVEPNLFFSTNPIKQLNLLKERNINMSCSNYQQLVFEVPDKFENKISTSYLLDLEILDYQNKSNLLITGYFLNFPLITYLAAACLSVPLITSIGIGLLSIKKAN